MAIRTLWPLILLTILVAIPSTTSAQTAERCYLCSGEDYCVDAVEGINGKTNCNFDCHFYCGPDGCEEDCFCSTSGTVCTFQRVEPVPPMGGGDGPELREPDNESDFQLLWKALRLDYGILVAHVNEQDRFLGSTLSRLMASTGGEFEGTGTLASRPNRSGPRTAQTKYTFTGNRYAFNGLVSEVWFENHPEWRTIEAHLAADGETLTVHIEHRDGSEKVLEIDKKTASVDGEQSPRRRRVPVSLGG